MNALKVIGFTAARMREISSYAGLLMALLGVVHVAISPDQFNAVLAAIAALGGAVSIFIPESK